eukprot:2420444-Prymnesium_polylepis.1
MRARARGEGWGTEGKGMAGLVGEDEEAAAEEDGSVGAARPLEAVVVDRPEKEEHAGDALRHTCRVRCAVAERAHHAALRHTSRMSANIIGLKAATPSLPTTLPPPNSTCPTISA